LVLASSVSNFNCNTKNSTNAFVYAKKTEYTRIFSAKLAL